MLVSETVYLLKANKFVQESTLKEEKVMGRKSGRK